MCMIAIAAAGLMAYAAYRQTEAQNAQNKFQADVAQQNAEITRVQGAEQEREHRKDVARMTAEQRVAGAASGTVVDDGSNLDVIGDTAYEGELDALALRRNTERKAWNFEADAELHKSKKQSVLLNTAVGGLQGYAAGSAIENA